jgi:hypothetical protein
MNQMEDRSGRGSRAGLKLAQEFGMKYPLDATGSVLSKEMWGFARICQSNEI